MYHGRKGDFKSSERKVVLKHIQNHLCPQDRNYTFVFSACGWFGHYPGDIAKHLKTKKHLAQVTANTDEDLDPDHAIPNPGRQKMKATDWIQVEEACDDSSEEEGELKEKNGRDLAEKEKTEKEKTEKERSEKEKTEKEKTEKQCDTKYKRLESYERVELAECQVLVNDLCQLPSFKKAVGKVAEKVVSKEKNEREKEEKERLERLEKEKKGREVKRQDEKHNEKIEKERKEKNEREKEKKERLERLEKEKAKQDKEVREKEINEMRILEKEKEQEARKQEEKRKNQRDDEVRVNPSMGRD